jgi:serine/threonine-protein kinase
MEYAANGSLKRVLRLVNEGHKLSFWNATGIGIVICGIVLGMRFIHSSGFIHQDLKPANIFLNADGRALIGDFGASRLTWSDDTPTGNTGTAHYAAPEQFKTDIPTVEADVFSFGLILYEILTGLAVFPATLTPFEIIREHNGTVRPAIPDHVCRPMRELIRRCLSRNPGDRPAFDGILDFLESNHFEIFPGCDGNPIQWYVNGVRDWEQESKET